MRKPLISVIMPCYNSEDTIESALKSLDNQIYKKFEVIIINDGSTDKTNDLIKKYISSSNMKIRYLYQTNEGVSKSRNKGLDLAEGEYLTFLDSDDMYSPFFLKELSSNLNEEIDTAFCGFTRLQKEIPNKYKEKETFELNNDELLNSFMKFKGPSTFATFIYKKEILEKYSIYFDSRLSYGEDLLFVWKYLVHCKKGVFVDKLNYFYNDNPYSVMNNISWKMTNVLLSVTLTEEYLKEFNLQFYQRYSSYMFDRTIWKLAKDFSLAKNYILFQKLTERFDVETAMKNMEKNGDKFLIKLTSYIFLKNKKVFYYLFSAIQQIKR